MRRLNFALGFCAATVMLLAPVLSLAAAADADGDGLSDADETEVWHTDPNNPDSDADGYPDGHEVRNNYDPAQGERAKLRRRIVIDTKKQELAFEVNGAVVLNYQASTGLSSHPTPKGTFAVRAKAPKAWSATYKLWMPYWLDFSRGKYGIHELPKWPSGYQESSRDLGRPASHGCVRLGVGPAKRIYDLAPIGTEVLVI